jgi:hypothetical protein
MLPTFRHECVHHYIRDGQCDVRLKGASLFLGDRTPHPNLYHHLPMFCSHAQLELFHIQRLFRDSYRSIDPRTRAGAEVQRAFSFRFQPPESEFALGPGGILVSVFTPAGYPTGAPLTVELECEDIADPLLRALEKVVNAFAASCVGTPAVVRVQRWLTNNFVTLVGQLLVGSVCLERG